MSAGVQVIRGVRLRGRDGLYDVAIEAGRISAVEEEYGGTTEREFEAGGRLLVPGFVNVHLHLDKCMLAEVMRPNESQTLPEAIEITFDHKRSYTVEEIVGRATPVVESAIVNGTAAIRAFADVGTIGGLTPLEGLLELKRRFEGRILMEVVAFPQEGIARDPGADALLERGMEMGADVVGGMPWWEYTDATAQDHVDYCFDLAKRFDKPIHMLADDTDDPCSRTLEYLALRTLQEGWGGRVAASHCGALAAYDHTHAEKVIGMVKEAGISIVSNAQISLVMDGRNDRGLVRRGITRVKELLAAGVNVATAQDDVHDPYYPFGKPDQIEVAQYMAHVAHLTYPTQLETVFDMITTNAARLMQIDAYGTEPGCRADLVLVDARTVVEALRIAPPRRLVFSGGKLAAESELRTVLYDG